MPTGRVREALGLLAGTLACVVLAIASLAIPTDRPGAKAPALVALTLIGVQFVVFLPFASYTAASLP